jgi:flagellar FliJ protein
LKRFRFRLEKILRYKNQIENRKKQILSERNNELNNEKASLDRLFERNNSYQARYGSLFRGKLNILGLMFSRRYLDKLYQDIGQQRQVVKKSEKKVNEAKLQLQAAMRDRKKYEKLKERKKLDYDYEAGREERKELDEIASKAGPKLSMDTAP